jgi:hypothetical protein
MPALDPEQDINAQSRFFPAWWMYILAEGEVYEPRPLYKVPVSNEAELALARSAQPEIVDAMYFLNGELVEPPELQTT